MASGDESPIFTVWTSDVEERDVSVICLCGELDVSTVPQFLNEVRPILSGKRHIIMDVHLLEYADSTAIAAILSTGKVVKQAGRSFCVTGSHGVVAKILDAILAAGEMERYDDVATALESVSRT